MASMRDIKRRKESVQSTEQITKAMKLVSSVKLTKAKQNAEESKPYFDTMYETVAGMIAKSGQMSHPFLQKGKSDKKAVIVQSRTGRRLQFQYREADLEGRAVHTGEYKDIFRRYQRQGCTRASGL